MGNTIIVGCNTQVLIGPKSCLSGSFRAMLSREVLDWTPERISSRLTQLTFLDQRWWQSDTNLGKTEDIVGFPWEYSYKAGIWPKMVLRPTSTTWEGNYMVDSLLNQGLLCQILMFMTWKAVRSIPAISAWNLAPVWWNAGSSEDSQNAWLTYTSNMCEKMFLVCNP